MFAKRGDTVVISASNVSANSAIAGLGSSESGTLKVVNQTTATAFVKMGTSAPTATTADYPVEGGGTAHIPCLVGITHVAVILGAAVTGSVSCCLGTGEPGVN